MTQLSLADVENIAQLARLTLTDDEKRLFQGQLSAILGYVDMLNTLDTTGVPPTTSALPLDNVMRPDEARPGLPTEDALLNAPDATESSFRVKSILP